MPDPASFSDPIDQKAAERALSYMGLKAGTPIVDIPMDRVFIGSCTNSRIDDLRAAAHLVAGKHVAKIGEAGAGGAGFTEIKKQAEAEGLDKIFTAAGFEWRDAGCSMCIGMNDDVLPPGSAALRPRTGISKGDRGGIPHASGESGHGGGSGDCGALRGRARIRCRNVE